MELRRKIVDGVEYICLTDEEYQNAINEEILKRELDKDCENILTNIEENTISFDEFIKERKLKYIL